jgi:hypothetical protein
MRSCISALQLPPILIEADQNEETYDRKAVLRFIKDFMIYAHFADAYRPSHTTQIILLDQLCSLLTFHDSRRKSYVGYDTQWIIDLIPEGRGFATFEELATLFNLNAYVRMAIQRRHESKRQALATSLLQYLLPFKDNYVYGSLLPPPGLDMVQLLLDNGADPNSTCNTSLSAWQKVLTYQANIVHDSSCPSLSDKSYDARVLQRRYIEMMQLLVLSGQIRTLCVLIMEIQRPAWSG